MKKEIKSVLVLGSGALKIGEAGEFDYSGTQALKSLKEEGIRTILLNPNIATVQTSPEWADSLYLLPVSPDSVQQIVEKEKPDAILIGFGGQTALNCAVQLYQSGFFKDHNIRVLGTSIESIMATEDRDRFKAAMQEAGLPIAESQATDNLLEAMQIARKIGYPIMVRAAYSLGGLGSGIAKGEAALRAFVEKALAFSPQVLIEASLHGWKELEYEIMRDQYGNAMLVCNMENMDPVGIHTGDSIVVAPSQTLSNEEYQKLRDLSLQIANMMQIVGACNVQFALHPETGECLIIEVNARLSRSSALASKATGYPIAYIAAKLALGYGLHALDNPITGCSSAFFEPAMDYVVCKIPRWDLERFESVEHRLGPAMKSVGEVMGIGGNFEEALQKAIRMLDIGMDGFEPIKTLTDKEMASLLSQPTPQRLFVLANALNSSLELADIAKFTKIDPWFLYKLKHIIDINTDLTFNKLDAELLRRAKKNGFSDKQIAKAEFPAKEASEIRALRKLWNIVPGLHKIDSAAGEFPAQSNYLYLSYHAKDSEIIFEQDFQSVIVLGGGPYRIGSSVEFDYCAVQCLRGIEKNGYRPIMINCNPETVSTDYDSCARLYFEELSLERIQDICELEAPKGVVVSMGGQLPNNLALPLQNLGLPILGTDPVYIEMAENRPVFSKILSALGISQPRWQAIQKIEDLTLTNFPLLIRPSFVLSGTAMQVLYNELDLKNYLGNYHQKIGEAFVSTFLLTEFVEGALELELDALAVEGNIMYYALSEHIETAGVHSGDATLVCPLSETNLSLDAEIIEMATKLADRFKICGLFNIQFLYKAGKLSVIELNLRASRSIPFVSKVHQINFAGLAAKALLGIPITKINQQKIDCIGVKAAQFSYNRLTGATPNLGVVMQSTGELAAISDSFEEALLNALFSAGYKIPIGLILIDFDLSENSSDWADLQNIGFKFFHINELEQGSEAEITKLARLKSLKIDLFISLNTSNKIWRRMAVDANIPLMMDGRVALVFLQACVNSIFFRHEDTK